MADRAQRDEHKPASMLDFLIHELRYAAQDIRQKLVEEPWFGRPVTPALHMEVNGLRPEQAERERPSFDQAWGDAAHDLEHSEQQRDRDGPELER